MTNQFIQWKTGLKRSRIASSLFYFWRLKLQPRMKKLPALPQVLSAGSGSAFPVRIAFICDEMTWTTFAPLCKEAVFVPSERWREVLESFQPDLLFCEATWHGIREFPESWRSQIFRNHRVCFEHRKVLFDLLSYCRTHHIPTAFWNKEDPTYCGHPECDFADTACYFDYIFTTAQECIAYYQQRGHERTALLPFGFSPELFHPLGRDRQADGAVYCGSWFPEHQQRCRDMEEVFSWLKDNHLPLQLYDRQMCGDRSSFPAAYQSYVHEAVPYEELGAIYRKSGLGININTVTNSSTMFARRFLEMAACALPIISNESTGLRRRFGEQVSFLCKENQPVLPDESAVLHLLREVFLYDTVEKRMETVLAAVGLHENIRVPEVDVYCIGSRAEQIFQKIDWENKKMIRVNDKDALEEQIRQGSGAYFLVLDEHSAIPDVSFWVTQFSFLPNMCGVGFGKQLYQIELVSNWQDTLWPAGMRGIGFRTLKEKYISSPV